VETPRKLGREEKKLLERLEEIRDGSRGDGPSDGSAGAGLRHPGTLPPPAGMR